MYPVSCDDALTNPQREWFCLSFYEHILPITLYSCEYIYPFTEIHLHCKWINLCHGWLMSSVTDLIYCLLLSLKYAVLELSINLATLVSWWYHFLVASADLVTRCVFTWYQFIIGSNVDMQSVLLVYLEKQWTR